MENVTKHAPTALLIASICRTLVMGAQISDSLIIIALSGLIFLINNLNYNKKAIAVQQELTKLTADLEQHRKETADMKAYVSSVKMATSLSGKK